MNRRGWTNEQGARTGWRAPVTRPVHPSDSGHPPQSTQPLPHGYPQAGEHRHAAYNAAPAQPYPHHPSAFYAPPAFDQRSRPHTPQGPAPYPAQGPAPRRDPAPRSAEAPNAVTPQPAQVRSNTTNPTGLWWLRPRAQTDADTGPKPVAPNLAGLQGELHDLTRQIQTMRERCGAPVMTRQRPQQTLQEIVAPLVQALPLRQIEDLDTDVRTLTERLDASRSSGMDPRLLAPIEQGLHEVQSVLHQLKPVETVAAFKAATRALGERLDHPQDGAATAQVESVIGAVRNIAGLAGAQDTLLALSKKVRGLTDKLQHIAAFVGSSVEQQAPAQPSAEPSSIEHSLRAINLRLDALQQGALSSEHRKPEDGLLSGDRSAQNALEVAHATLSELVAQLAGNLKNTRNAMPESAGQSTAPQRPGLSGYPHATGRLADFANEYEPEFGKAPMRNHTPHPLETVYVEPELPSRSIVIPVRPLIFGAMVIILAVVAARVSVQLTDAPLPAIAKADASQPAAPQEHTGSIARPGRAEMEVPDLIRSQAPDHALATPERPVQQSALAIGDQENSGVIGRPVTVPAGSPETAMEPAMPLPGTLPAALRAEAMKGKPSAEYEVGVRLVEGKSAPVNAEEGVRWLKRAAKSGIIPAHLWIGSLYEKGLGVEKDLKLARTHYLAAAEKGNAKAMHNLAVLHAEGVDGRRDYKTAVRWFQRAADRGIADSQYNLAVLMMRGVGIDQNHQEAYKWFALAALQGDREAARHRDEIGRKLEPGALAAAQTAVRTFVPQQQPNEAVTVAAPAGGWDRATEDARKSRSGIFARGAS